LRVERFETTPYALSFREPYVTARGVLKRRELALLRISAGGAVGIGEAAPLLLRGGPSLEEVLSDLDGRCRPVLDAEELDLEDWDGTVARCRAAAQTPQAGAAVELALLDLIGKLSGRPVWSLLGAERARPVRCNATLAAGEPRDVADRARDWASRGFDSFKLKVGMEGDVEQVGAVREALGPDARLRLDANGAWTVDEAITKLGELEWLDIELVEQPVAALSDMALVRRRTTVPVAADESVTGVDDARKALETKACDLATVKLAKVGGTVAIRAIADVIPVYLSSALDGPVGIAAALHAAQLLPRSGFAGGLAHGLATLELFEQTVASGPELSGPALEPDDAPGFGVEIDADALEQLRI
jgi:L-Ala-D/L-Glu epimerase / N-acetyl-D-glutamate racemase